MSDLTHPFNKTWWVQPGNLLAGCYPGDLDPLQAEKKVSALLDAGIRSFLCLQPEGEKANGKFFAPYLDLLREQAAKRGTAARFERIPILDLNVPTASTMKHILDHIDASIADDMPVYLHCWGGHGRTATVVGCWLVRHGLSGDAALARIGELRKHDRHLCRQPAPQTHDQLEMVRHWREE